MVVILQCGRTVYNEYQIWEPSFSDESVRQSDRFDWNVGGISVCSADGLMMTAAVSRSAVT